MSNPAALGIKSTSANLHSLPLNIVPENTLTQLTSNLKLNELLSREGFNISVFSPQQKDIILTGMGGGVEVGWVSVRASVCSTT